jgi:hypothetical protein
MPPGLRHGPSQDGGAPRPVWHTCNTRVTAKCRTSIAVLGCGWSCRPGRGMSVSKLEVRRHGLHPPYEMQPLSCDATHMSIDNC